MLDITGYIIYFITSSDHNKMLNFIWQQLTVIIKNQHNKTYFSGVKKYKVPNCNTCKSDIWWFDVTAHNWEMLN